MYFELYLDELFLENLLLDACVLLLTVLAGRRQVRLGRIFLTAAAGSLLTCLLVLTKGWERGLLLAAGLFPESWLVRWTLGISSGERGAAVRAVGALFACSFLLEGMIAAIRMRMRVPLWVTGLFCTLALSFLIRVLRGVQKDREFCEVILVWKGQERKLWGLWDTGNRLRDPYFGKPVTVVEYRAVMDLFAKENQFLWIPYRTVGRGDGWMPGFQLECMYLGEERRKIEKPVVALSKEALSTGGRYQVILPSALTDD